MIRQISIGTLLACLIGIFQWTFKAPTQFSTLGDNRLEILKNNYHEGLDNFQSTIEILQEKAKALSDKQSLIELQRAHLNCRMTFKSVEFLMDYYDHEAVDNFINGAPLPGVEPKVADVTVLEPEGLQVLDELIFSDDPFAEKEAIVEFSKMLGNHFTRIQKYQKGIKIYDRHIFEAARSELVRIFSLGLTGFDTPGSLNAILEAKVSLNSLYQNLRVYIPLLQPSHQKSFNELFKGGLDYLKTNTDFDSFDRLAFLKTYINPLYSLIYQIQYSLGVEMIHETTTRLQPTNYDAQNIFSEDFLNPYFFANIHPSDITPEKAALGKLLFFDPILSKNNKRACASCHQPDKAFTDGIPKSLAFDFQGEVNRNAPTVINAIFAERYFYDLRQENIERQIEHVVFNGDEFNTDFEEIINKLKQSSEYVALFKKAFPKAPTGSIAQWTIENAITSYVLSLVSFDSPFDQYVRGESDQLSQEAIDGFNLFMGKAACGTCHFAPTFNGLVPPYFHESETEVLGVPVAHDTLNPVLDQDPGRIASGRELDKIDFYQYSFKTVTVRNAGLTAPYMHNGAYETLESVIDFYNRGGGLGMGLDVPHQTLPGTPLNLTDYEQKALITFMETLNTPFGSEVIPDQLPKFDKNKALNNRKLGGEY